MMKMNNMLKKAVIFSLLLHSFIILFFLLPFIRTEKKNVKYVKINLNNVNLPTIHKRKTPKVYKKKKIVKKNRIEKKSIKKQKVIHKKQPKISQKVKKIHKTLPIKKKSLKPLNNAKKTKFIQKKTYPKKSTHEHYIVEKLKEKTKEEEKNTPIEISEKFPFLWYINIIKNRFNEKWHIPEEEFIAYKILECTVSFKILKNGKIIDVKLKKSSKVKDFDRIAINTVKTIVLPPLPQGYLKDYLQVNFTFRYNSQEKQLR